MFNMKGKVIDEQEESDVLATETSWETKLFQTFLLT